MNLFNQSEFLALALVHFFIVVSPGPDFAVTLRQSIYHGRKAGLMTALGIGAGISVHVVYTLIGVTALMQATPWLMDTAKYIGAAYLIWLGIQFLRSKGVTTAITPDNPGPAQTAGKAFWMGFLTNATNPKAMLFFLAIFTTLVSPSTQVSVKLFYGVWMCGVNAAWFMAVSVLFSHQRIRERFLAHSRLFDNVIGAVLLLFAGRLLLAV
ncbi:lysine transporter LysE [Morganella morganii]|uniref:LysE family translocator n=1 Tax=Morganella morganii TaxID=582 RepID=UPI0006C72CC9|nr:LysE family transporter [Morganella morganii]KOO18020.1 lysine transporter LysE [Morganella morganii]